MGNGGAGSEEKDSEPEGGSEGDTAGDVARLQDLHEDRQQQHQQGTQLQAAWGEPSRQANSC